MHLPGHLRVRFGEVVDEVWQLDRLPGTVGYPQQGRPKKASIRQFLRLFVGCSDIPPKGTREAIGELYFRHLGSDLKPHHLTTYRNAARRLDELRRGESELAL